jgi:hypothetical protein
MPLVPCILKEVLLSGLILALHVVEHPCCMQPNQDEVNPHMVWISASCESGLHLQLLSSR